MNIDELIFNESLQYRGDCPMCGAILVASEKLWEGTNPETNEYAWWLTAKKKCSNPHCVFEWGNTVRYATSGGIQ